MHATRAAVKEGIVPGGGVALLRASEKISNKNLVGDEALGADILKKALEGPIRQIVSNAGLEESVVVNEVKNKSVATTQATKEILTVNPKNTPSCCHNSKRMKP